jgi:hypothetical protein
MSEYFTFDQAYEMMNNGQVMSSGGGNHDYYRTVGGVIVGMGSCSDALYELESSELKEIVNSEYWYIISGYTVDTSMPDYKSMEEED